jgi:hypothetical protein
MVYVKHPQHPSKNPNFPRHNSLLGKERHGKDETF